MLDYTPNQKKIIERYYDNRDDIMLSKLSEIVTDLFLAETDSQRKRLWSAADRAMKTLKVPASVVNQITNRKQPDILAAHLRDWLAAANKSAGRNRNKTAG